LVFRVQDATFPFSLLLVDGRILAAFLAESVDKTSGYSKNYIKWFVQWGKRWAKNEMDR
jgi:hypothetical protein